MPGGGGDFSECTGDTYAYTKAAGATEVFGIPVEHAKQIYICQRFFGLDNGQQIEVLIHESAHKAGFLKECTATRIQVRAMSYGSNTLPWSGMWYLAECGLIGKYNFR